MTSTPEPRGSFAVDGEEERRKSPWWLWLLLAALLLALLIWALTAFTGDDEPEELAAPVAPSTAPAIPLPPVAPVPPQPGVSSIPDVPTTPATTPSATASAGATTAPDADGAVVAGGVDVLTSDTDLTTLVGEPAVGTEVEVTEVVGDETFYVGPEAGQTVLVRLPEFAGEGAAESPFTVEQGDTVSFTGTLAEVDDELLDDVRNYDPSTELEVGSVYVQAEEISGVS